MASNPSRVIVQLGANVENLVTGMNQAIAAMKGTGSQITGALKGIEASSISTHAALQEGLERSAQSMRNMIAPLAQLFTAYQAFSQVKSFVGLGIETNAALESAQMGIAGLIMAQGKLINSRGEALSGEQAYAEAMSMSAEQIQKLRVAGLQTAATTVQLTDAFKSAVSAGLAAGLNLDQIREVTIRITQAAQGMGVPMDQLRQEVVSILRATIDRNSVVANALNITSAEVKLWKEKGILAQMLLEKTEAFEFIGVKSLATYSALASNIRDAVSFMAAATTKPLFESLKGGYGDILGGLFDVKTASISAPMSGVVDAMKSAFAGIGEALRGWIGGALEGLRALSAWLQENRARVAAFASSVGALAGAGAAAFGSLLSAAAALANAGLGPLTAGFNVLAALLSSTAVQAGILVYAFGGPVVSTLKFVWTEAQNAAAIFGIFRAQLGLAATQGATGLSALSGAMRSTQGIATGMGSSLAGLLNPWALLASLALGAAFAYERWITAGRRASEESLRMSQHIQQQGNDWRDYSRQLLDNEKTMAKLHVPEQALADAMVRRQTLIAQLVSIYPNFNKFLFDEAGHERSIAEALRLANEERDKDLRKKAVRMQAELDSARENLAEKQAKITAGFGSNPSGLGYEGYAWAIGYKAAKEQVENLENAMKTLRSEQLASRAVASYGDTILKPLSGTDTDGKEKSLVDQWRADLEQMRADQARTHELSNAEEAKFWHDKLELAKKGGKAVYDEVHSLMNRAVIGAGKDARAADEKATKEQIEANKKLAEEEKRSMAEDLKMRDEALKADEAYQLKDVSIEEKHWRALYDSGAIGQDEFLAGLQEFEDRRFEIEKKALEERLILHMAETDAWDKYQQALRAAEQKHEENTQDVADQGLTRKEATPFGKGGALSQSAGSFKKGGGLLGAFEGALDTGITRMSQSWAQGLAKMLRGALTFSQAVKGLWLSLRDLLIQSLLEMVAQWIASEVRKLVISTVTKAKQLILHTTTETATVAATKAAAASQIIAGAGVAAVNAMASVSAIPYVGWAMAPGVGAGIYATGLGYLASLSAEGGADIGNENPIAQLHMREMVLPANIADKVRAITTPMSAPIESRAFSSSATSETPVSISFNINAMDGADVHRVLQRNKGSIVRTIADAHREGRFKAKLRNA